MHHRYKLLAVFVIIAALYVACKCSQPLSLRVSVQTDNTTFHNDSAWLQLPCNYKGSDTTRYPLLIFYNGLCEGSGDPCNGFPAGTNLNKMLQLGPPKFMADSTRFLFGVASKLYGMIVVCPQSDAGIRSASSSNGVLNYMISHYKVDTTRIYLTGLSLGAASLMQYLTANQAFANRIAAAVPMSITNLNHDQQVGLQYIANAGVHVQVYCGNSDQYFTNNQHYVDLINAVTPGLAVFTSYVGGHGGWNNMYTLSNTYYNPNMYQWMLQFHR
jgi:predicted peptidase